MSRTAAKSVRGNDGQSGPDRSHLEIAMPTAGAAQAEALRLLGIFRSGSAMAFVQYLLTIPPTHPLVISWLIMQSALLDRNDVASSGADVRASKYKEVEACIVREWDKAPAHLRRHGHMSSFIDHVKPLVAAAFPVWGRAGIALNASEELIKRAVRDHKKKI